MLATPSLGREDITRRCEIICSMKKLHFNEHHVLLPGIVLEYAGHILEHMFTIPNHMSLDLLLPLLFLGGAGEYMKNLLLPVLGLVLYGQHVLEHVL